ncbi:MAG: N-acetylmuramic acid 6-phosphate etherase [Alicyclobacillus sp.]|nr:N-acetylmuramic acid 6-phosphate etherase [Alicyclobacillus sp.]
MLEHLQTEQPNKATERLDRSTALEVISLMNEAEKSVPLAVEKVLPDIARAIEAIVVRVRRGGRIFYVGAGTSGRLGILDAAECPPTFSTPPELVQSIIAGGRDAVFEAVENAEDDETAAADELKQRHLVGKDIVVGLSASGRTPFVVGAIRFARQTGALTITVTCNERSVLGQLSEIAIDVNTGPEVLMGSTRLKAGTAQKMVLNMLSTGTMVQLGKVYKNLMVDMKATNHKLQVRANRIVRLVTGVTEAEAATALTAARGQVKLAILMLKRGVSAEVGTRLLERAGGHLRVALGEDRTG